ncbi:MAG: hypothetical protein GY927_08920 [bacterium]|nr:hypothetical protein [bacterium]
MRKPVLLTYAQLRKLAPRGKREILERIAAHSSILGAYGLAVNKLRLCHFLAQAAHETAGFRTLVEYGSTRYFRRRYGHRRDLGNVRLSDGSRYRGRGIFQLTGRANYRRYGQLLDVDLEASPLLAKKPELSLRIACEYWQRHDLNRFADRNDIRAITKRINGGYNGLQDRRRFLQHAMLIWMPGRKPLSDQRILQFGDHGKQVARLQSLLRATGRIIAVDGLFGYQTLRVLKNFQSRNRLRADGLYGPLSRQVLARVSPQSSKPKSNNYPFRQPTKRKETKMDQWKSYLSSRTIWANLIGFGALALDILGFNGFSSEDKSQLVDQVLKLVEAGGFIAGVIFRALARSRLGPRLF